MCCSAPHCLQQQSNSSSSEQKQTCMDGPTATLPACCIGNRGINGCDRCAEHLQALQLDALPLLLLCIATLDAAAARSSLSKALLLMALVAAAHLPQSSE
jgi:hypothetical protein